MAVYAVLAEGLAVVGTEDHHGAVEDARGGELLAHPPHGIVHPADGGEVGTSVVGAKLLEAGRSRVLVHVHEVEIQKEGLRTVVRIDQAHGLLNHAVRMGPERGPAQARVAPALREHVAVEALVEAEALVEPAVGLHAVGGVAGLAKRLGQRDGALGEAVLGLADAVAARPERGHERRHRDLGPRGLGPGAFEQDAARCPRSQLGGGVAFEAVGCGEVGAQRVDDDEDEIRRPE